MIESQALNNESLDRFKMCCYVLEKLCGDYTQEGFEQKVRDYSVKWGIDSDIAEQFIVIKKEYYKGKRIIIPNNYYKAISEHCTCNDINELGNVLKIFEEAEEFVPSKEALESLINGANSLRINRFVKNGLIVEKIINTYFNYIKGYDLSILDNPLHKEVIYDYFRDVQVSQSQNGSIIRLAFLIEDETFPLTNLIRIIDDVHYLADNEKTCRLSVSRARILMKGNETFYIDINENNRFKFNDL